MYEIDYVFDEMSLFHIEELFDISILSSPPNSVASSNKLTQENFKLQQEIVYYNKLSSNQHVETNNLKKAALKKLLKKGRKITLFDIDKFVNKFGSSKDLEGHLKSHSLFIERATPKDSAINIPDFSTKDKKKRA